ncbi:hypothetical protein [Desulfosarcina ovata]|uniref:Periplasmic heavy metal sensor n=2 Tax=Desulfosarcina ovata TaxID=83564 RepID=A0A5K8AC56_9BACT|nr:hypothetical protein [Desulfosarcina ovata]BBO83682.1 hypothetical protein DSCO28_42480 [Desulfosarcina ovata subsp. sediminis]BBO90121.1 hypothetical protein DSCOOX_33010 [Desulfosarcina ovata subsp. ovata]
MKLTYKRILIFFSVALNIGFVVVALTLVWQHAKPAHQRSWREIVDVVDQLALPASESEVALDNIRVFRSEFDQLDQDLKTARGDILRLLARKGPLDREQLHGLMAVADACVKRKSERFEVHVMALRQLLGDEKGAQFFSLLEKKVKPKGGPSHQ